MTAFGAAILGCEGPRLSPEEARFFAEAQPFGFIVFDRNLKERDQIRGLVADLRGAVGRQAPVFIDQEGGRVQRMRPPLAQDWRPPLEEVAQAGPAAADIMALRSRIISAELAAFGIDGNCSPALDVARDTTHPILRNRLLGSEPEAVARIGLAIADAHLEAGILPVIKHMPGHGLATRDSHLDLPRIAEGRDTLDAVDFAAFRPLAHLPLGMTAHLVFDSIDPHRPATVSPDMIALIRDEIGFGGFLMTDDISMEALSGTVAERGAASLEAGCDAVLHCNGDLGEMRALMERIGSLDGAGMRRAEAALAARRPAPPVDIRALQAEFEALIA